MIVPDEGHDKIWYHKAKDLKMNHEMFMVDAEKSVFVGGHVNINDQILS
jgi:hypothetical protein